jgi:hypothetical protein
MNQLYDTAYSKITEEYGTGEGNEGRGKTQHERDMAEQQVGCAAIFQPSIYG